MLSSLVGEIGEHNSNSNFITINAVNTDWNIHKLHIHTIQLFFFSNQLFPEPLTLPTRNLANSMSFSVSGNTSLTASWPEKCWAHLKRLGVVDSSSIKLTLPSFWITLIHPKKHPNAISKYPISSPPKNLWPLLHFEKASSNKARPRFVSSNTAFLASSPSTIKIDLALGYHCNNQFQQFEQWNQENIKGFQEYSPSRKKRGKGKKMGKIRKTQGEITKIPIR